jgi:hypothetical protein
MTYLIPNTATELLAFYGATPGSQPTAAAQAAVTDNSGGTAAPTTGVAAVAFQETIVINLGTMAGLANSVVYKIALPYAFTVSSVLLRVDVPVTTSAKAATLTSQIAGTAITGGVISASGTYATGATQAGSAITALNVGTAGQTLEIAVSSVTAFTEGTGHIEFTIVNTSRANAAATQIAQTNAIRSGLVTLGLIKGA